MDLQKFGIKLFFQPNGSYPSRDFIPELHRWIQNDSIPQHMLIDVVDYSHIPDGPGIMLIAHEGQFSFDLENNQPGVFYLRKTKLNGNFDERIHSVLNTAVHSAGLIQKNEFGKEVQFLNKSFRFIANDRRLAENNKENQELYSDAFEGYLNKNYPSSKWELENFTEGEERLAFTVNFQDDTDLLKSTEEGKNE